MAVTLKDIADRAGVSVSTVSRVLNNDPSRKPSSKTSEKVWQIIQEMQYVPNEAARMLIRSGTEGAKHSGSKSIGCILSACDDLFVDPFFDEVIAGVHQEVIAQGFSMEYTFPVAFAQSTQKAVYFNNLVSRKVAGAVLLGRFTRPLLDILRNSIPRLVYCGLNYVPEDIPQVICDATRGIPMAVEHLIALGHKRIGFIGETNRDGQLLNERRFHAFEKALQKHDLPLSQEHIVEGTFSLGGGYQAMGEALGRGAQATAYVCGNDITAVGAMRAIYESGLSVPGDISLIGFDDVALCSYVTPSLTTIHTEIKEMGIIAARTLADTIRQSLSPMRIQMPFRLIERESTARPKA